MTCGYKACAKELFLLVDRVLKLEKAEKILGTETLFPTFLVHLIQLHPTTSSYPCLGANKGLWVCG